MPGHAMRCAGSGTGSGVAHAASRIAAMWVVILEMVLALGLAAFIIWWTWPKKPPGDKR